MRALLSTLTALACAVGACSLPDPGTPCGTPTAYEAGTWLDEAGAAVADTRTEDSIPHRWHCTPSADLVKWFADLDEN
jgi:hypothetical protein